MLIVRLKFDRLIDRGCGPGPAVVEFSKPDLVGDGCGEGGAGAAKGFGLIMQAEGADGAVNREAEIKVEVVDIFGHGVSPYSSIELRGICEAAAGKASGSGPRVCELRLINMVTSAPAPAPKGNSIPCR
jgi:hypothetical protein